MVGAHRSFLIYYLAGFINNDLLVRCYNPVGNGIVASSLLVFKQVLLGCLPSTTFGVFLRVFHEHLDALLFDLICK